MRLPISPKYYAKIALLPCWRFSFAVDYLCFCGTLLVVKQYNTLQKGSVRLLLENGFGRQMPTTLYQLESLESADVYLPPREIITKNVFRSIVMSSANDRFLM